MLRVLTLSSLFPDASRPTFGVFVERQTLGLAALPGVELRVVAPIGLPPFPLDRHPRYRSLAGLPARETWKGLTVHRPRFRLLPGIGGRFNPALMARALLPLLRDIRRDFAFDVIDAQFFYPDGPAAAGLGRAVRVPASIKARGADIHHWGALVATRRHIVEAAAQAGGLLAVSAALRDDMAAIGIDPAKVRVHYTGVDLDRFAPADRAAAKASLGVSGPLVVSVGALIERKGHALTIDAVAALPGVSLLIAGHGPERGRLAAHIDRLGAGDRIRLLGSRPHEALPALLAAADVMALPSASEGLANAWVEALACGTPIVIADVGGARELLDLPEAGRIVARDPAAIAAAIRALIADPPDPSAVRVCAARFTWEANAAALFDHLSALTARGR